MPEERILQTLRQELLAESKMKFYKIITVKYFTHSQLVQYHKKATISIHIKFILCGLNVNVP